MPKPKVVGIILEQLLAENPKYQGLDLPVREALRSNYGTAVKQAGGLPIFISPSSADDISVAHLMDICDGFISPGGVDINPKFYGQEALTPKLVLSPNDARDNFEQILFKEIINNDVQALAICRGIQMLNVHLGGTIIQDIPSFASSSVNHQAFPPYLPSHPINIYWGSKLFEVSGQQDVVQVNSNHHQAIDKLGKGLRISATALDGIIEGVEYYSKTNVDEPIIIGAQWHPESLNTMPLDLNLFKWLIGEPSDHA